MSLRTSVISIGVVARVGATPELDDPREGEAVGSFQASPFTAVWGWELCTRL